MSDPAGETVAGGRLGRDPHQEALDRVGEARLVRVLVGERVVQRFVEV
ncbi:hypothetical protein ACGF0J_21515 [Nonomuraea sp. NPDC047897]